MAVTNSNGKKLDLVAIKTQLIKDRNENKVSEKDYRRSMKGLDTVTKAGDKGVTYQFTGNGRFKTTGSNGQSPSMNEAGVGISTKIPLFGKKVSKGLGYAQKVSNQQEAEAEAKARRAIKPDVRLINPEISMDDIIAAQKKKKAAETAPTATPTAPVTTTPEKEQEKTAKKSVVMPDVKLTIPDIPNIKIEPVQPNVKLENPEITAEDIQLKFQERFEKIKKAIVATGIGVPAKPVYDRAVPKTATKTPEIKNTKVTPPTVSSSEGWFMKKMGSYNNMRASKPASSAKKKLANGGKVRSFGNGTNGSHAIQEGIGATAELANKRAQEELLKKLMKKSTWLPKQDPIIDLKNPEITAEDLKIYGDRRTMGDSGIPPVVNENPPKLEKDSIINTALGAYGAASLLTAKKPTFKAPESIKLNIRPAQGDEDMVSRSNTAIDESLRQGVGMLRNRTGSDLSSYVQGTTAMVDNAGKGRASVLGQNAQLKRQDEVRMSNEINQGKQINHADNLRFKENIMRDNLQTYMNRVQGAQGALNNSLNYGVQKGADERNLGVQREMVDKRYNTQMVAYAKLLHEQGYTPAQIAQYLKTIKEVSYSKGGKLQTSEKIVVNANKILGEANKELRKVISEYSKLISNASTENIRQFNQNIRAISKRSSLTVTLR